MIARSWLDDPNARPALTVVPDPPPIPFKVACLPEYRRRLLGVYHAIAGWPPERTAPLHLFRKAAEVAFEVEAEAPWRMALDELERRAGITAGAGMSPGSSGGGT